MNNYVKGSKTRFQRESNQVTKSDKGRNKEYGKRGISIYDGQEQINRETIKSTRQESKNQINFNRGSSGFSSIVGIPSSQKINNRTEPKIRRYKGNLSKQAMKEYAIKKANSSNFNWEADEEAEM